MRTSKYDALRKGIASTVVLIVSFVGCSQNDQQKSDEATRAANASKEAEKKTKARTIIDSLAKRFGASADWRDKWKIDDLNVTSLEVTEAIRKLSTPVILQVENVDDVSERDGIYYVKCDDWHFPPGVTFNLKCSKATASRLVTDLKETDGFPTLAVVAMLRGARMQTTHDGESTTKSIVVSGDCMDHARLPIVVYP